MHQVEGGGQMAAQTVARDRDRAGDLAGQAERLVPGLHVGQLAEGKTLFFDLQTVGGFVVARGVVDELGAAEGENEFVFLDAADWVISVGFEQRAAEAGSSVGDVLDDRPLPCELRGFGRGEFAGVEISVGEQSRIDCTCLFVTGSKNRRRLIGVERHSPKVIECFRRHLQVGELQVLGYGRHLTSP